MEARAQDRIDDDIGLHDELLELGARGAHDHVDVAAGRSTGHVARERRRDLIGLERRDDVDRDALLREDVGRDPAVAAVVAKADEDEHALGRELEHLGRRELAGMLHKARPSRYPRHR